MTMFGQPKPLASLSSTLLARKGQARPAMRPQGFGGFGAIPGGQDDLGWNDMGHPEGHGTEPVYAPQPSVPPVLRQREALQEEFESPQQVTRPRGIDLSGHDFPEPAYEPEEPHLPEADVPESYEPHGNIPEAYEADDAYEPAIYAPEPAYETDAQAEAEPEPEPAPLLAVRAPKLTSAPASVSPAPMAPALAPVAVSPAVAARIGREASVKTGKAAFTLRLDHDRHLRLRLASALHNCSAQVLVTQALDAFLQSLPEVEELARQLPSGATR